MERVTRYPHARLAGGQAQLMAHQTAGASISGQRQHQLWLPMGPKGRFAQGEF